MFTNSVLIRPLLLSLALAAPWLAHAQGTIELQNVAEVETLVKTADGKTEKKRSVAVKTVPGMEVIYTTTFKNVGAKPAGNINLKNFIPPNTTLVAGSPWGEGTDITYSADGGKTWAPVDKIKVKDASGKDRPAGLTELTHIRWSLRGDLPAGQRGEVGFRVIVN